MVLLVLAHQMSLLAVVVVVAEVVEQVSPLLQY